MKITYTNTDTGQELKLECSGEGVWSGDDEDLVVGLNERGCTFATGRADYHPTLWHEVKAVADVLHGTLDEPEPKFATGPPPGGGAY
jgi:hypothetical protein